MPDNTIHTRQTPCPKCGKLNDACTEINGEMVMPETGDVSMCFECGAMAFFQEDRTLRLATDEEAVALKQTNREIRKAAAALEAFHRTFGRPSSGPSPRH